MADSLVRNVELGRAVSQIAARAERLDDQSVLLATFVDTGAIVQLENDANQILFGRRGSGKTHVLRVLGASFQAESSLAIYVDCRVLGSSGFALQSADTRVRAGALFRDIAKAMTEALLNHATELEEPDQQERALAALGELEDVLFTPRYIEPQALQIESTSEETSGKEASVSAGSSLVPFQPALGISLGHTKSSNLSTSQSGVQYLEERLNFPEVNRLVTDTLDALGLIRLIILIDEWAEIPASDQPYVAQYLKRAFFANPRVVVKIAALEYRSNFNEQTDGDQIGLEIGGDIFAAADLDDYFLPDRNPAEVQRAYADLLARHLGSNLQGTTLEDLGLDASHIASRLFTQSTVFNELVRASEGVPRDFINIFVQAFFDARRRDRETIDRESVINAARKWYEQDKRQNLSEPQSKLLYTIVQKVIGDRKARCFMLEQGLANHPMIRQLYDLRVIHRLKAGYSGRDQPGVRYDIYALDYGTYVDLKNTAAEPQLGFDAVEADTGGWDDEEFVVPFDDNRSIRRIILSQETLDAALAS